ncbi:MAG: hypothetical protein J6A05_04350 [Oscillospiraceae bacterium]|nr:hypothetical protein [Oscillospiraceae bacterium]
MFNRKFSAIALSMLCLTACSANNDVQQTSVSETTTAVTSSAETTASIVTEAVTTTEITEEETAEETTVTSSGKLTPEEYFSAHGYDYRYDVMRIHFDDNADPITSLDSEMLEQVTDVLIFESENNDLSFIKYFPNLTSLSIRGYCGEFSQLTDILGNLDLNNLNVLTHNYDPADAENLIRTFPECEISYSRDSSPWMEGYPEEGFNFYVPTSIVANSLEDDWVCRDREVGFDYPNSEWSYFKGLICVFSNCTDKVQTAETAQLFRIYDGETPILFKNGTDTLEVNFEVQPQHKTDFLITHDMLDYSALEAGIYKIVFTSGEEKLEQQFSVYENSSPVFLTEEQLEIFNDEHESTYKQMVYNDRGFDISHFDDSFLPVYSSDDEVVFQNIVTHAHEDNPYFVWFESLNYRMIKTDDGWKFDIFQFWY